MNDSFESLVHIAIGFILGYIIAYLLKKFNYSKPKGQIKDYGNVKADAEEYIHSSWGKNV